MRGEISDSAVAAAVDFAATAGTAQLVIISGGAMVVDEVYKPDPVDVYAVQKGFVSVLFGMAEDRGLLSLDDQLGDHLGRGWSRLSAAAEAGLRIVTVLDMTTGMDDELGPLGEVGRSWRYNNIAYNYLKTLLEVATGLGLSDLSRSWLFEPLGMASTRWVERVVCRPDGRPITGMESTARDLAAFGTLVLGDGAGLAPASYISRLGRPGSEENPAWGLCWWNNDQAHHRLPRRESDIQQGPTIPEAPADMILAQGAMGNRLAVVPSLDLVVARTAAPVERGSRPVPFDRPFWERLTGG